MTVTPDPLGHDDDILTLSEMLDEDNMAVDPLEELDESVDDETATAREG